MNSIKVGERLFAVEQSERYYLVYTYPFQVFEVEADSLEETVAAGRELLCDGNVLFRKRSEDFHNFISLDWLITADCNLNCRHCFAKKTGDCYRYGLEEAVLALDDLRRSVDLSLEVLSAHLESGDPSVRFELFIIGGEPLMQKDLIYSGIRFLDTELERFRVKHELEVVDRQVMIVTNGIEIDDAFARFCREKNIGITVSVDAPGYTQKVDEFGRSHTPHVIQNLKLLLSYEMSNIAVNFVIPPARLKDTDLVFEYLQREGILDRLKTVQMSPQIPPHRQTQFCGCAASEVMISDFGSDAEACELFAEKMLGYDRKYHMDIKEYNRKMASLIEIGGMAYRCPAAQNKFCVVPGGDIYPCHQLIGISGFEMGNVRTADRDSLTQSAAFRRFRDRRVFDVEPCRDCVLQSVCITFVDCPARCYLESGDMKLVPRHYCRIAKGYLEAIFERFLDSLKSIPED